MRLKKIICLILIPLLVFIFNYIIIFFSLTVSVDYCYESEENTDIYGVLFFGDNRFSVENCKTLCYYAYMDSTTPEINDLSEIAEQIKELKFTQLKKQETVLYMMFQTRKNTAFSIYPTVGTGLSNSETDGIPSYVVIYKLLGNYYFISRISFENTENQYCVYKVENPDNAFFLDNFVVNRLSFNYSSAFPLWCDIIGDMLRLSVYQTSKALTGVFVAENIFLYSLCISRFKRKPR